MTGGGNKREDKFVTLYIVYKYQADYQIWNVGRFQQCKTLISAVASDKNGAMSGLHYCHLKYLLSCCCSSRSYKALTFFDVF